MSQAIGILELTSIAKGMELGDAMLKSANVNLLVSKTICPGKFLLMLGGDIGAIQQAIETGASQAGRNARRQPGAGEYSPQRPSGHQRPEQRGQAPGGRHR